jgi:hypothetical protein
MTYNRTMRAAFIRFLRFLAWIELASVPVIYWTRDYLVWVFGPAGMTAVWWFCGFTVACALVVLVRFRVRRPAENPAARPQRDIRGNCRAWKAAPGRWRQSSYPAITVPPS